MSDIPENVVLGSCLAYGHWHRDSFEPPIWAVNSRCPYLSIGVLLDRRAAPTPAFDFSFPPGWREAWRSCCHPVLDEKIPPSVLGLLNDFSRKLDAWRKVCVPPDFGNDIVDHGIDDGRRR
jgi:hypothetical protein